MIEIEKVKKKIINTCTFIRINITTNLLIIFTFILDFIVFVFIIILILYNYKVFFLSDESYDAYIYAGLNIFKYLFSVYNIVFLILLSLYCFKDLLNKIIPFKYHNFINYFLFFLLFIKLFFFLIFIYILFNVYIIEFTSNNISGRIDFTYSKYVISIAKMYTIEVKTLYLDNLLELLNKGSTLLKKHHLKPIVLNDYDRMWLLKCCNLEEINYHLKVKFVDLERLAVNKLLFPETVEERQFFQFLRDLSFCIYSTASLTFYSGIVFFSVKGICTFIFNLII